jgi:pimeloyl-ACP methyl ester carboxylesterase
MANGLKLHYLDWGAPDHPPLVLLHGLRGHAHSWDDFSAAVCEDYHVLALDQRGRGDSEWAKDGVYTTAAYVADLADFSAALHLDSFILIGHSMGGRNGMAFSARYPDKVRKLVVVDISPGGSSPGSSRIRHEISTMPEEFPSFEAVVDYISALARGTRRPLASLAQSHLSDLDRAWGRLRHSEPRRGAADARRPAPSVRGGDPAGGAHGL